MATSRPASSIAVEDPKARQLVQKHLFDRVEVIAGQLEYTLIPLSICTQLSSLDGSNGDNGSDDTMDSRDEILVCVDDHLVYARFFADFGPLDLGQTVRFCQDMTARLATLAPRQRIVLFSSDHPHKRANAMTLLALFLVVCHNRSPEDATKPFQTLKPGFGFRDAGCGVGTFFISILDCARAVYKAMKAGIWTYGSFSLDEYEHYDQLQHGDINWIIPGKILAFSGPQQERIVLDEKGSTTLLAHDYAKVFQKLGVTCVVRFNEPSTYDRRAFIQANIRHLDMLYPDGGNPPDEILHKFLWTCERESGAIAVHCKAGLGRTGTNIAAYLMKHYHFTAVEAIAWCRICRPGSIVGPQQQFLVVKQPLLWQAAADQAQPQQSASRTEGLARLGPKKQQFAAMLRRLPAPEQTQTQLRLVQQSRKSLG